LKTLLVKVLSCIAAVLYIGQSNFNFEYPDDLKVKCKRALGYGTGAQVGSIDEKKPDVKNLVLLSL
jgi:hypothetical protein